MSFPGKQTGKRKIQQENSERTRGREGEDVSNKNRPWNFEGNH